MKKKDLFERLYFCRNQLKNKLAQMQHYINPFDIEIARSIVRDYRDEIYEIENTLNIRHYYI